MAIDLGPVLPKGSKAIRDKRLAWVLAGPRWVARRGGEAASVTEVRQGAQLIASLVAVLRRPDPDQVGPLASPDGRLDVSGTASALGISVRELEQQVRRRRRQTALVAWGSFVAGWSFLGLWAWQTTGTSWSSERIWAAVQFLPFCAVFFVLAFRSAWQNWQLRTGQLGSAGDYLRTADPFWPSVD